MPIKTELYPKAESRHSRFSEAYQTAKKSIRGEWLSGITGVSLALFMWGHMLFVSSILTGNDTFDLIADLFELTWLAQITIILVIAIFFIHFVTASRKIPGGLRDRKRMLELGKKIKYSDKKWNQDPNSDIRLRKHSETSLWIWQVRSGMIILVLGSVHLFIVGTDILQRALGDVGITALESTTRVGSGLWLFYVVLLICVEFHAGIGLYRFSIKWLLGRKMPILGEVNRHKSHIFEKITLVFLLIVGFVTLAVLAGLIDPPLDSFITISGGH